MSLLIKGMEMPNKCISCRLMRRCGENDLDFVCMPARVYVEDLCNAYKPRPDWCPLVSVPPHGRLGDLDTLQKQIDFARNSGMLGKAAHYKLQKLIKEAPTIIPAEEGET